MIRPPRSGSARSAMLVAAVVAVALAGTLAVAQRPGGPGGPPGGRGRGDPSELDAMRERMDAIGALDVLPMWAALSFESGIDGTTLESLRASFARAWTERATVVADTRDGHQVDWDGVKRDFSATKKHLDLEIKSRLTPGELEHYQAGLRRMEDERPRGRGRRGF